MLAGFNASSLIRCRPANIVLALLTGVVLVILGTFTARAWLSNNRSAKRENASITQQKPGAEVNRYVRRARLRPQLNEALSAVGNRLEQPGKERLTLTGTLKRQQESSAIPFRLITETPHFMRLEEQIEGRLRVIGFDGDEGWALGSVFDNSAQETIELLVFDSIDHFFLGQTQGLAVRPLGSRFRLDDGTTANYSGPFHDIYQIVDLVKIGPKTRQQPKLFYLNSNTQLLERVRYQIVRDSKTLDVDTQITRWQKANDQQLPRSITRSENNQTVLTITIESAVIGQRAADGIFNRP